MVIKPQEYEACLPTLMKKSKLRYIKRCFERVGSTEFSGGLSEMYGFVLNQIPASNKYVKMWGKVQQQGSRENGWC